MAHHPHLPECCDIEAGIGGMSPAAYMLRGEYLDALRLGDPDLRVSTPGLAVESMSIGDLLVMLADQQLAMLHAQGAL